MNVRNKKRILILMVNLTVVILVILKKRTIVLAHR